VSPKGCDTASHTDVRRVRGHRRFESGPRLEFFHKLPQQATPQTEYNEAKPMNIPDEKVLEHLTHFDFGHKHKLTLSYQAWEFPFGGRLEFTKDQTPTQKKELIISALQFAHKVVKADIRGTLPEIVRLTGDSTVATDLQEFYK
jgi:hypothetical protein